ncbi:hydrogenase expression protein HupH [Corynebacterium sphenisci DSM 44792]|uniref:Hydrogenase expression protein HupH n=1 Tax=Corynebacterium sphenisci DSM 44792 TaxID=1437874 RepID=A0A1L7CZJ7_9CORY|nr:hydrogenase maturation nickel metallochaperone HypA [Corynebacterium sphenisci]APT91316.1 hydrogenase expression protein HupH [Corynebacterium sphenisci DSM 44792]
MHELGLLTGVVGAVAGAAGGREVAAVGLRVGARSGVVVEALHAAWPLAAAGGCCAGARLVVEELGAAVWCPACAAEREIDEYFALTCPVCGFPTADLRRGREFEVAWVDIRSTS